MAKKTFYDVLQVSRNADPEIIKAAYKSLVQRYHPDKNPYNPDAEKNLKIINRAYEVLSDPVKRAGYDAALAEDDEDAATSNNKSKESQTASHTENDAHLNKTTERAAPFDRSTTQTKKREYHWILDVLPSLALAAMFKSLVNTGFHGSPEAAGWVVFFAMLLGGGVGFPLFKYLRTQLTKNMQNRHTVFLVSLALSLGIMLAIVTTTVLLEKSVSRSAQNSVVPKNTNPLDDPNFGISTLPPSASEKITASNGTPKGQGFDITLNNNNPDWAVTSLLIMLSEIEGRAGTAIPGMPSVGMAVTSFEIKDMINPINPYGNRNVYLQLDTNKAYIFWLSDIKGFRP